MIPRCNLERRSRNLSLNFFDIPVKNGAEGGDGEARSVDFGAGISHQTGGNSRKDEKIAAGTASLSGAGVLIRVLRYDEYYLCSCKLFIMYRFRISGERFCVSCLCAHRKRFTDRLPLILS